MTEFEARLRGERLTTAEIVYFMPDHPLLLQAFTWQTQDRAPEFPRMRQFLDHWRREIEAVIHSVRVASGEPLSPPGWRKMDGLIRIH